MNIVDQNLAAQQAKLRRDLEKALGYHQAGKWDRAENLYQKVLARAPDHADALHLLGTLACEQGRPERAIQFIRKALASLPHFAPAHSNLGNAFRASGRLVEAAESYRRAIALQPNFAAAHSNLGRVLNEQGDFSSALASCRAAIALDRRLGKAHVNLAVSLKGLRRMEEAEAAYRAALDVNPADAETHCNLGLLLAELDRLDEARACYATAIALKPSYAVPHYALGSLLYRQGDAAAAVTSFRRAVNLSPGLAEGWLGLGRALRGIGDLEEAVTCFRHALKLNPDFADAYRNLALTGAGAGNGSETARLADLLDQSSTPLIDRITAGFALGKLLDDAGAFPEAFRRYADANALFKRMQADMGQRFDSEALRRTTDGLIETFTPGFFAELARADNRSELPVFIVGMPRSGTSLVEQIVASHPDVFGAGELTHIGQIAGLLRRDGAEFCSEWKAESLSRLSNDHLGKLLRLAPDASRIVDKMPDNLFHLGLISMLFPRARVIVCRRDPRDTCLSCYFQFFPAGNLFSYDLADCGIRHRETERLMIHWRQVLPIAVIEVEYELLVSDLEGQSRRLIAFLGLDWNPACLDFYRTKRTVLTASSWQVRQPLFAGSVGRWRRYERELGPLMESLGAT